jgi:hypothetical protein
MLKDEKFYEPLRDCQNPLKFILVSDKVNIKVYFRLDFFACLSSDMLRIEIKTHD